jgi:hypothetical protein
MAQIIQIPLSVEFRTTSVSWVRTRARITGWWKRDANIIDEENLVAEVANGTDTETYKFPLRQLPDAERKQCLSRRGKGESDEDVKRICSSFQPEFLIHSRKTYIRDADLIKNSQPADAWKMRGDFLRMAPNYKGAMKFLSNWGRWRPWLGYADVSEMIRLQEAVREALTSAPKKWFASYAAFPPMVQSRLAKYPFFCLLTDACQSAIRMTVTIDLLRHLTFKVCARRDCGLPFPVTSKHKREYCSQSCAHLESVRRSRKTTTMKERGT